MQLSRASLASALLFTFVACGPQTSQPTRAMVLVLSNRGVLEPRAVELRTITDVVSLQGQVASFFGGARVVVDSKDPLLQLNGGNLTDAQYPEVFLKNRGAAPRANFVDKAGVLWPADFHTWNLLTAYYNFEKSFEYFQGIYDGKPTDPLRAAKVYYFAEFILADQSSTPLRDNALFFSPIQGFLLLPFEQLQKTPLALNPGVMAHEYAHRVFNQRALNGEAVPAPLTRWLGLGTATPALNLLKAMDEGLADFHGYGTTCLYDFGCNPRWAALSFDDALADARDISSPDKCMTAQLRQSLNTLNVSDFTRGDLLYQVGDLLAAALYQAGNKASKLQVLQKAVLNAYADKSATHPGFQELISANLDSPQNFTLAAVANAILAHVPDDELRKLTCTEFLTRLQVQREDLPACPAASAPSTACPTLAP